MRIAIYNGSDRYVKITGPLDSVGADYSLNPKYPIGFDVIVCDTPNSTLGKLVATRRIHRTPVIYRMRGNAFKSADEWMDRSIKKLLLRKYTLQNVDGCIPITTHHKKMYERETGVDCNRVTLPIDPSEWPTTEHREEELRIVTLTNATYQGKVKPLSRIAPVVDSVLQQTGGKWIIGSWSDTYDYILKSVSDRYPTIEYSGPLDAHESLEWANCMIHHSDYDGLPNAILEGMASRIPVLCNDYPSFCEIGEPLVISRSDCELKDNLLSMSDRPNRDRFGELSLLYVRNNHSPKRIGMEFIETLGYFSDLDIHEIYHHG